MSGNQQAYGDNTSAENSSGWSLSLFDALAKPETEKRGEVQSSAGVCAFGRTLEAVSASFYSS